MASLLNTARRDDDRNPLRPARSGWLPCHQAATAVTEPPQSCWREGLGDGWGDEALLRRHPATCNRAA